MTTEPERLSAAANPFERLAPFIQDFVWRHGWTELRDVQVRATAAAFDTDKHLLLAAGTASGKTEAAFLPILTELYESPSFTVGALYVGPLKALINDQFLRLGDLCLEAEIPVTAWHGDISMSRKHRLLKKPGGILQITPEALEGLLLNRSTELTRVFGDLRWVVIDEVHAFMASDRGGQVLSLLDRLSRYALDRTRLPRRIGLSATLGDYEEAAAWLKGSTRRGVEVITDEGGRTVNLLVDHFLIKPKDDDVSKTVEGGDGSGFTDLPDKPEPDGTLTDRLIAREKDFFDAVYAATQHRKSLIFANSRGATEEIISGLRRLAENHHSEDIYYVHHGSISASLREAAETAMRDREGAACTAATVTLELGIDLGQLDRILQLGPTFTVASFLQRLGRAGRRGQTPEMFFLLRSEVADSTADVLKRMPWDLLQTIAIIQLYAEEKWLEPFGRAHIPGSLLYQQTMSVSAGSGELTPAQLAERVLTLSPFANVTQDDFRSLLRHLLEIDHLQRTDEGGLILGLTGERVVRDFRFLATFFDSAEWAVKNEGRDIGTIANPVRIGERFALAGRTWEVIDIVFDQRVLVVSSVKGSLKTHFRGTSGDIHDRIVQRMRKVLAEDTQFPYLTERASFRLSEARVLARAAGIANRPCLLSLGGNRVAILPWVGSRVLRTLNFWLSGIEGLEGITPENFYSTTAVGVGDSEEAARLLLAAIEPGVNATEMVRSLPRASCERAKYDEFLPEDLLKKGFAVEHLDAQGALTAVNQLLA
jgi:ATP-dependent Lhr-like helicase